MNIIEAQRIMIATHVTAIQSDCPYRASAIQLQSGPGVGKSECVKQGVEMLCRLLGELVGFVTEFLPTLTSPDIRGFMLPVKGTTGTLNTIFSVPPWYPTNDNCWICEPDATMDSGVRWHAPGHNMPIPRIGWLFLDEWSQTEDEVKKPAAELLLNGNVGNTVLPSAWRVIAAGNRPNDRSGVMRELMFVVNRRMLLNIDPHLPTWRTYVEALPDALRPHYLTISFAVTHPETIFRDTVPDGTEPYGTPRSLMRMDRDLRALRTQEEVEADIMPTHDLARELCTGWIGQGAAAQYFTHLKFVDQLPTITDIINDPSKAKLPSTNDAQMVCAYMLAHHINQENVSPIFSYLKRLVVDMQVLAVRATRSDARRARAIAGTPGFSQWLASNKELLLASS